LAETGVRARILWLRASEPGVYWSDNGRMRHVAGAGKCALLAIALSLVAAPSRVGAINSQMAAPDIERATGLARFPHTDAERAQFHAAYTIAVRAPDVDYFTVKSIEIITPFRRLELIAEAHARTNDLFARGGISDAEDALRPWRDRVSIVAHVEFDQAKVIPDVPALDMSLQGSRRLLPMSVSSDRIYSNLDRGGGSLIGASIEAAFDARSIDQGPEAIAIFFDGRDCAHTVVDFSSIE
jgi:hypothetical protein